MSPRADVSEQRKIQIVEAAMAVFARSGFAHARMEDIAHEAGLSIGGIYWYFKGKDELVAAILAHLFDDDLQSLRRLLASDLPVYARLLSFADQLIDEFEQLAPYLSLGHEFYTLAVHDGAMRNHLRSYLTAYRTALAQLIDEGIRRKEFAPVNSHDVASAFIALYDGLALHWAIDPDRVHWRSTIRLGVRLLLAGLTVPNALSGRTAGVAPGWDASGGRG